MVNVSNLVLLIFSIYLSEVFAVENYYKCLECLSKNRSGYFYCDNVDEECLEETSDQCAISDQVSDYYACPEVINQERCFNYTFTAENFDQTEPIELENILDAGQGCFMQIDRTADGSYGTVAIEYGDNRYVYVFDDYIEEYATGEKLGLIEE